MFRGNPTRFHPAYSILQIKLPGFFPVLSFENVELCGRQNDDNGICGASDPSSLHYFCLHIQDDVSRGQDDTSGGYSDPRPHDARGSLLLLGEDDSEPNGSFPSTLNYGAPLRPKFTHGTSVLLGSSLTDQSPEWCSAMNRWPLWICGPQLKGALGTKASGSLAA